MRKVFPFAVAIGIFVLLALLNSHSRPSTVRASKSANAFDACVMAQVFVKKQLKAPSTADFAACNDPETYVAPLAGNIWKVSSYVDAQNSFGAQIRNDYTAKLIYYPATNTWNLTDLSMNGR